MSSNSPTEQRRASGTFANLMDLKKRHSTDASINERRLSHSEMKPAPGFLGSMWNNLVKPGHTNETAVNTAANAAPMKRQSIHRTGEGTLG